MFEFPLLEFVQVVVGHFLLCMCYSLPQIPLLWS